MVVDQRPFRRPSKVSWSGRDLPAPHSCSASAMLLAPKCLSVTRSRTCFPTARNTKPASSIDGESRPSRIRPSLARCRPVRPCRVSSDSFDSAMHQATKSASSACSFCSSVPSIAIPRSRISRGRGRHNAVKVPIRAGRSARFKQQRPVPSGNVPQAACCAEKQSSFAPVSTGSSMSWVG